MARKALIIAALCFCVFPLLGASPVGSNQTVVIMGDSITDANQYSAYLESWWQLYYPASSNRFRTVSQGGTRIVDWIAGGGTEISQYWTIPWNPDVVFSMLGINDGGADSTYYANQFSLWTNSIQRSNNLISAKVPLLVGLGVEPNYSVNGSVTVLRPKDLAVSTLASTNPAWTGVTLFDAMSNTWCSDFASGTPIPIFGNGDATHPFPCGELQMAARMLNALGLPTNVSSAMINATAGTADTTDCTVSNLTATLTSVYFRRLDAHLPMAWDQTTNNLTTNAYVNTNIYTVAPAILGGQRHMLVVTNLAPGWYYLKIDSNTVGTFSKAQLASGVNLAAIHAGSYWTQRLHVLNLIRDKQGRTRTDPKVVNTSLAGTVYTVMTNATARYAAGDRGTVLVANLSTNIAAVKPYDTNIWAAAQPQWRSFELTSTNVFISDAISAVNTPSSAKYRVWIGNAPADVPEVQTLNPPIFRWIYDEDPTTIGYPNTRVRTFRLRVSKTSDLASPIVDVTTSNNFYNFLPAFTNADGSTYVANLYWGVTYLSNAVTISNGTVHTFQIAPSATMWDRSKLADVDYVKSVTTNHPHVFFWETNRDAMVTFLKTNTAMGWNWLAESNSAIATLSAETYFKGTNAVITNGVTFTALTNVTAYSYLASNEVIRHSIVITTRTNVTPATNIVFADQLGTAYAISNIISSTNAGAVLWTISAFGTNQTPTPTGFVWTATFNLPITNASFYTYGRWFNRPLMTNGTMVGAAISAELLRLALLKQMTTNAVLAATNVNALCSSVNALADYCLQVGYDRQPSYGPANHVFKDVALLYDWLYNDLTTVQRTNLLGVMESCAQFYVYEDWWYCGTTPNINRIYTNALKCAWYSHAKAGVSHERHDAGTGLFITLAAYNESAICREMWQYFQNYMIGQIDPFNRDEGRFYAEQSWRTWHQFGAQLLSCMLFRELHMERNPWYANTASFFAFWEPKLYLEDQDQFGDFAMIGTQWFNYKYRALALLLNDGAILRKHVRDYAYGSPDKFPYQGEAFLPFYYSTPAETDWATNAFVDRECGWVLAQTLLPTDTNAFNGGQGWVISARPGGGRVEHETFHDGNMDYWAYGAQITCGNVGQYRKHPDFLPGLFVDGIGVCYPNSTSPLEDIYAHVIAFTNANNFAYAAVEIGPAMNRKPFTAGGGGNGQNLTSLYTQSTNKRPDIISVQRYVLWPGKKYLVLLDKFSTSNAHTFQWKWNTTYASDVNTSACSFVYPATNRYCSGMVTTYVAHIVDPSQMRLTNILGRSESKTNPFTGIGFASYMDSSTQYTNSIWVSSVTPTTNFHFMSVIYPKHWTNNVVPVIYRSNDYTARIVNSADQVDDVVTFDTNYSGTLTYMVDAGAMNQPITSVPTFPVPGGSGFTFPVDIIINGEPGCTIIYSNLTTSSGGQFAPGNAVHLAAPSTIQAMATNQGKINSAWSAPQTYTATPTNQVNPPDITPNSQMFYPSINVTFTCSTPDASIAYVTDTNTLIPWVLVTNGVPVTFTNTIMLWAAAQKTNMVSSQWTGPKTYTLGSAPSGTNRPTVRTGVLKIGNLK